MGSWQKKLSGFASSSQSQQLQQNREAEHVQASNTAGSGVVVELGLLKVEWHQFLEHLSRKNQNFMAMHLQSCELVSCTPGGVLEMVCCRKFSYEELLQERLYLQKEIAEFYSLPIQVTLSYDAEKDACTREKTVFTLFQELLEKNEVIQFLVKEFGGELVY